jgi:hypothetical protein
MESWEINEAWHFDLASKSREADGSAPKAVQAQSLPDSTRPGHLALTRNGLWTFLLPFEHRLSGKAPLFLAGACAWSPGLKPGGLVLSLVDH